MRKSSIQYPVASSQGRGWIQSIAVFFVLATPAVAQTPGPEAIALDSGALQEIVASQGKTIDVDPATPVGRFLRTFALVGASETQVTITPEVIERAQAIRNYFAQPRYFPGKQILAKDHATGYVTHRATIKEVLPGDQYKVDVVEVLEWNSDHSPKKTQTVERVISHDEVARYNDPTQLAPGKSYLGIRHEPVEDPLLREAIERANQIVDTNYPDFRKPPEEVVRQQRNLFLELMKVAKMMDHSLSVSPGDPQYRAKMEELARDPFYGGRRGWVGAYLKSGYGVCTEQASVATQIINSVARRAGIDMQLVTGETLDRGAGHGFTVTNFRGDPARNLSDPSWENNTRGWWKYTSLERYSGNLLQTLEHALGASGWGRNRRITNVEAAEQVRTPLPSKQPAAQDRVTIGDRIKGEVAATGVFVGGYLLKEAMKAIETRDLDRMKEAAAQLATGRFWIDLGAFTVAARWVEAHLASVRVYGAVRHAVPLAVGMAAVQLIRGQVSARDIVIDTASFLTTGWVVTRLFDEFLYPYLFSAGPPGMVAAAGYTIVKMAITLYAGEKLAEWLKGPRVGTRLEDVRTGGILQRVRALEAK